MSPDIFQGYSRYGYCPICFEEDHLLGGLIDLSELRLDECQVHTTFFLKLNVKSAITICDFWKLKDDLRVPNDHTKLEFDWRCEFRYAWLSHLESGRCITWRLRD